MTSRTAPLRERRSRPRPQLVPIDAIVDMMRARILDLVALWKLQGHRDGHDFVAYNPLRNDRSLGSFKVAIDGPYKGMVKDFAGADATWSPLSFTAELWFGGDQSKALKWARAWLGLDGTDPESLTKTRAAVEIQDKRQKDHEGKIARTRAYAKRLYLSGSDQVIGSPVDLYLQGRGIALARFPFPVRCLRYHPALHNGESDRAWPAMLAPIVASTGDFLGVHRTWLEVQGDGSVRKAPLEDAKLSLGTYRGGLIRLWNGIRVEPDTGEILAGRKLREEKAGAAIALTEGIEDGLSVALAFNELRVAAGVSLSNMIHLQLPDVIGAVEFWRQNDTPGSQADKDFRKVAEHQAAQGKRVTIVRPPAGVKDANDALRGGNDA